MFSIMFQDDFQEPGPLWKSRPFVQESPKMDHFEV